MPFISPEAGHLTVLNLFTTDASSKQDRLLQEMRSIVDTAAFEGWISSTVHAGVERPGTANFIQWRSGEDLERRYAGDEFRHRTVPLFTELTDSIRLLRNEVVFTQRRGSADAVVEISPDRDDFTVIEFYGTQEQNLEELISTLGPMRDWLLETPGYRSHIVLRGLGARYFDGAFAVTYSQWDSKEAYDAFRSLPARDWPADRKKTQDRIDSLAELTDWNTYRVVHSRSAGS